MASFELAGGAIDVEVIVEHQSIEEFDIEGLAQLIQFGLRSKEEEATWSVAVVLTSDTRLQDLHREFMAVDEPTDVMTFPAELDPGLNGSGGDIVISMDRAEEQGPLHGLNAWQEVRFLAMHGVLHLLGWDDTTAESRRAMHAEQTRLISTFDAEESRL